MTGIIDDDPGMTRIAKKIPLEEIFGGSVQDGDISIRPITQRNFLVKTYFRNAEKVAFNQTRKFGDILHSPKGLGVPKTN